MGMRDGWMGRLDLLGLIGVQSNMDMGDGHEYEYEYEYE